MRDFEKIWLGFAIGCILLGLTLHTEHGYNRKGEVVTRYSFYVAIPGAAQR